MITVYLSSTFRDLKEYRREILDFFAVMKDRFKVVNMEDYTAEDRRVCDKCLDDVAACDLYILLIGKTYGSIAVDPVDPNFNKEGYSYTELEYRKARECKKEVLTFRAKAETTLPEHDPDGKLAALCDSLKGQLSGSFLSPNDLLIQLMRSLANRYMNAHRYDERIVYKCDRTLHSSTFLMKSQLISSAFRSVMLYGRADELCRNLVNKLSVFHLSLNEEKLGAPISFEDFLDPDDYHTSLQLFLFRLYQILQLPARNPYTVDTLLADIGQRPESTAIVMSCDVRMLQAPQMRFLQQFFADCLQAGQGRTQQPFYFFFCLEEKGEVTGEPAKQKLEELEAGLSAAREHNIRLPRLGTIRKEDIQRWLEEEITPSSGTALQILKDFFSELGDEGITMLEADRSMGRFIQAMNAASPASPSYINLY